MNVFELIIRRRSASSFTDEPLEDEIIESS